MTEIVPAPSDQPESEQFEQRVYTCPNCWHEIPKQAWLAIWAKIERGEYAECDFCPY